MIPIPGPHTGSGRHSYRSVATLISDRGDPHTRMRRWRSLESGALYCLLRLCLICRGFVLSFEALYSLLGLGLVCSHLEGPRPLEHRAARDMENHLSFFLVLCSLLLCSILLLLFSFSVVQALCCFRFPFISSLLSCWRCRCGAHWQTASRTARVWRSSTRHRQGTLLDSRSVPEHLPESNWRSTQLRRERTRYAYVGAPHHALSRLVCPGSFYLAKFCTYFIIIDFGHPTAGLPQFMDSYDFTLASHPARASTAALTRHHLH
jgi:hypothetical protein